MPVYENILNGNPGNRKLKVLSEKIKQDYDIEPPAFLKGKAIEIFNETAGWLLGTFCLGFINPQHIAEYAQCKARWQECEEWNDKNLLAKHPTTGQPMASPYVEMGLKYLRQADAAWSKMYDIVKANSMDDLKQGSNPNEDVMEKLLRKKGK